MTTTASQDWDRLTLLLRSAREVKNGTATALDNGEDVYGFIIDHHQFLEMHVILNSSRYHSRDAEVKALVEAAEATCGRLRNAGIDLMTGKTKAAVDHNLRDIVIDLTAALAPFREKEKP